MLLPAMCLAAPLHDCEVVRPARLAHAYDATFGRCCASPLLNLFFNAVLQTTWLHPVPVQVAALQLHTKGNKVVSLCTHPISAEVLLTGGTQHFLEQLSIL